jgi:WD40 repeat protein
MTGAPLTPPLVHDGAVNSAAFSARGTCIVTASDDTTAGLWDAQTGRPIARWLAHHDWVTCTSFSPSGSCVVTVSWDKTARIWDAWTGEAVTAPLVHGDVVSAAAFSPDGSRVVTASWDKTARIWDAATGPVVTSPLAHDGAVVRPGQNGCSGGPRANSPSSRRHTACSPASIFSCLSAPFAAQAAWISVHGPGGPRRAPHRRG